jgi:hypothetical protein
MANRASPQLDQSRLLDAIPTRNAAVRAERRGDALVLWVPIRPRWWMQGPLGYLLPLRKEKGVALDGLGQEVWQACDGQQRLEKIIEAFSARHRVRFHEARISVLQFLRSLSERNLVAIVVPQQTESANPGEESP